MVGALKVLSQSGHTVVYQARWHILNTFGEMNESRLTATFCCYGSNDQKVSTILIKLSGEILHKK